MQIINEGMLEDVNNILNSGDVPNLYGPEEMDRIMTACRPLCAKKRIPATKLNVFAQVRFGEDYSTLQVFVGECDEVDGQWLYGITVWLAEVLYWPSR